MFDANTCVLVLQWDFECRTFCNTVVLVRSQSARSGRTSAAANIIIILIICILQAESESRAADLRHDEDQKEMDGGRRAFIRLSSLQQFITTWRTNVFFLSSYITHILSGGFAFLTSVSVVYSRMMLFNHVQQHKPDLPRFTPSAKTYFSFSNVSLG